MTFSDGLVNRTALYKLFLLKEKVKGSIYNLVEEIKPLIVVKPCCKGGISML